MKKILSLLCLMVLAITSAWAEGVKVTWTTGENGSYAAAADPTTAAADMKYAVGAGLTENGTSKVDDVVLVKFDQNTGSEKGANGKHDQNVQLGKYVDFTFSPVGGDFTPTKVNFDVVKVGTGDPSIDVDVIDAAGNTIAVASNVTIRKNSEVTPSMSQSFSVSGAESGNGAVTLRIVVGKLASGKAVAITNVVIEGDLLSSDAPVLKSTQDVTLKVVPFTPEKTATAIVALNGKNLQDGIYYPTLSEQVEGLSLSPESFSVQNGVVNQEFTLTYAPTADTDWGDGEVQFVVGDMLATTTFSYHARLTPYEPTTVSEAASWDWETLTEIIELSETSVPSSNDEFVFKELEDQINFGNFDAQSIIISKTVYPSRNKKFQNGTIKFNTSVDGVITVDFSDTGSSDNNPVKRYLYVNGKQTEFFTQRDGTSDRKVSGEIVVPAGEVSICGWDPTAEVKDEDGNVVGTGANVPICVYKVTFEPRAIVPVEPEVVTFDFSSPDFREGIGDSMSDPVGFIYNEFFTQNELTLQVTAGSAPSRIYSDANRGQCLVTYKEYTTLTFYAPEGKAITKIEFVAAGNSNINNFTPSSGTIEGMTWTGNADGVRFQQGGTSYLAQAIVTLEAVSATTEKLAEIEYVECPNIARFNALEPGTYAKLTLTDAEVIGKSADGYSTVFIQDATGGAWIQYMSVNQDLPVNTKMNGYIYTVKRNAAGKDAHLKEAEDTPLSMFESTEMEQPTVYTCATIAEANEKVDMLVKLEGATFTATSATAGTLTLGEETIKVNNGNATANQQLHMLDDFTKDETWENVTIVGINTIAYGILPISIEIVGETEAGEELNVERYTGMGYAPTYATVDLTAAKEFLGVEDLTTTTLTIINPDGSEVADYVGYDGWFNAEGTAETWSSLNAEGNVRPGINVKFFEAIPNGQYSVCDMNGADVIGNVYTTKWAIKANGKTYTYTINVTFVEAPVVELEKSDLSIVASVGYPSNCAPYQEQTLTLTDEQVQSILTELGLESLADADVYGYNPTTGELLSNYEGFDGWRDTNGDFANHTGDSTVPACVKYTDGQNYYCYAISGCPEQTIKTYWAIANKEKYVLVEIDFTYTAAQKIERQMVDLGIKTSVVYDVNEAAYTEKMATITDEQLQQILTELGLESVQDEACEVYIYNPSTQELVIDGNDGWRDANGDSHGWTDNAETPICVKFTDGISYACYNKEGVNAGTYTAYWAIANDTKAVLVQIDFIYEGTVDGIDAITAAQNGQPIYNLQGLRLEKLQKGLNIVGGKKIIVK